MRSLICVIGFVLFSNIAIAGDAIQIDVSKSAISEQQRLVLKTLNEDAKYSEITARDHTNVVEALDRITATLSADKNLASLDAEQRKQIELDQELVNKTLAKAYRDSRLICTQETKLGSNRIKRVCKTAAARNRENDNVRVNGMNVNQ